MLGLAILSLSGISQGHTMKQVRAEISAANGGWDGSVWLEAWALYPEDGAKIPPGTPGDPKTAGNDWVDKLDASDHKVMRDVAAEFLSETFVLTLDGKPLKAEFTFPDYKGVEQPVLKENDDGNSLVRIDLRGRFLGGASGALELTWQDDEDEPLALEVKTPELKLLRLAPRQKPVELMMIGADGAVTEGKESSLVSWIV